MTEEVVYVSPDNTLQECMAVMTHKRIRHLPVMDGDKVAGVISIGDVVKAIISAEKANLKLTIKQAMAIDLAGRDVVDAVLTSVIPKIIETPLISGIAKDGIQVKALARVTVRTNIDRLVGGAGAVSRGRNLRARRAAGELHAQRAAGAGGLPTGGVLRNSASRTRSSISSLSMRSTSSRAPRIRPAPCPRACRDRGSRNMPNAPDTSSATT
jgi:CBS domain-containing protein